MQGDRFLEVGGGTGYGAALAARLVGAEGTVVSVECVPDLARRARDNLRDLRRVRVLDELASLTSYLEQGFNKVLYCFAIRELPAGMERLPRGGRLVAPVLQEDGAQLLTLVHHHPRGLATRTYGEVLYVPDRTDS